MTTCNSCTIEAYVCAECGITYGLDRAVVAMWRKSHKKFVCPNGHSLAWDEETPEEKELKSLKEQVKSLSDKLTAALKDNEDQGKRIEELVTELEIWKPSEKPS